MTTFKEFISENTDRKSAAIGAATAWLKNNFKSFQAPFPTMRIPTSGSYIMAVTVSNPGWDKSKRIYLKVTDEDVKQTTVRRWNDVADTRKAMKADRANKNDGGAEE